MSCILKDNSPAGTFNTNKEMKSNCAQEQEVNDLVEFLKLEYKKYIRYKILYNILEEYINEDNDKFELKMKIKNIMKCCSVSQTSVMNCKSDNERAILGLKDIDNLVLSYAERNQLTEDLKIKIQEKSIAFNNFLQSQKNPEASDIPLNRDFNMTTSLTLNFEDNLLIHFRDNLLSEQEQYVNNLLQLRRLLQEIAKVRLVQVPETTELKIKEYQIKDKLNQVKSIFTEQKCKLDIFRETSYSLKAYKELIQDIKTQQQECAKEIDNLHSLKEKYKQVSCKQYNDILESYLQYRSSIERKKRLYNCLTK